MTDLLQETSRSFYLTLRVLPARVRPQIGLAYLLARTTDTIADTEFVPLEQRLDALQTLRERILGQTPRRWISANWRSNRTGRRSALLERCEEPGDAEQLSRRTSSCVRDVLEIITGGQELDLRRFAGASAGKSSRLQNDAELDDYTYRVAGCVGEFWTKMCRAHVFPEAAVDETSCWRTASGSARGCNW